MVVVFNTEHVEFFLGFYLFLFSELKHCLSAMVWLCFFLYY